MKELADTMTNANENKEENVYDIAQATSELLIGWSAFFEVLNKIKPSSTPWRKFLWHVNFGLVTGPKK